MSTELETSYGGVVVRGDEVLVITPTGRTVTGLPKGGMEAGESPEQAAAREVREETGVVAAARGARGAGRGARRAGATRRRPLHVPARRPARAQDRPLLPLRLRRGL